MKFYILLYSAGLAGVGRAGPSVTYSQIPCIFNYTPTLSRSAAEGHLEILQVAKSWPLLLSGDSTWNLRLACSVD